MVKPKILAVAFEVDTYKDKGHFNVPAGVREALGLGEEDKVRLVIETPSGERHTLDKELKSGAEIYGPDVRELVEPGQRITVTASRPESAGA